MVLFRQWLEEAIAAEVPEANAVCLCTADSGGVPDGRVVLLKGVDDRGLRFFTNYESGKGRQLEALGLAAMVFWWEPLKRQVRFRGAVERLEAELSDQYFASRPRESQLGAWASQQSQPLESREALEELVAHYDRLYPDDVPRPRHWGGYRLIPQCAEFWQGRTSRLHDRFRFQRGDDGVWTYRRLMP